MPNLVYTVALQKAGRRQMPEKTQPTDDTQTFSIFTHALRMEWNVKCQNRKSVPCHTLKVSEIGRMCV